MAKIYKTFEEQINLLTSRGLLINDIPSAIKTLSSVNYYRLNVYFHQYLVDDHFPSYITFEKIFEHYENDRKLRHVIIQFLEEVEVKLRCQLAYEYGKISPLAFYDSSLFENAAVWHELHDAFDIEITRPQNSQIYSHYKEKYNSEFEIWIIVEFLSFGNLSKMYSISSDKIKNAIAGTLHVHETLVLSWLNSLSMLRNICAHYGYLRNRVFDISPAITKVHRNQIQNKNSLFPLMIALSWMIDHGKKEEFIRKLSIIDNDLVAYGFPTNWKEFLG